MKIDLKNYSKFLEKVAEEIDIPPGKYQDAVDRYQAVGNWLESGHYSYSTALPDIYPQGSFRLGTVIRPIRNGVDADYDIDLVCELLIEKHLTDPKLVKMMVGDRLKEHGTYKRLLDKEGKRCWTLEYAEQDGIGFHLDILPSVPEFLGLLDTSIAITNKRENIYSWSSSDPKGYGRWFDKRNHTVFGTVSEMQKRIIQQQVPDIYTRIEDVPNQLIRTPLQRAIQLMKRHRDVKFNQRLHNDLAPISIIITTLAASLYRDERDVYSALNNIITQLHVLAVLIENGNANHGVTTDSLIKRLPDGRWYIGNPVNPKENFADRWHEDDHARARAFFMWVSSLKEDLLNILVESRSDVVRKSLSTSLGEAVVSKHLNLIVPIAAAISTAPKVHISEAAKPWRRNG